MPDNLGLIETNRRLNRRCQEYEKEISCYKKRLAHIEFKGRVREIQEMCVEIFVWILVWMIVLGWGAALPVIAIWMLTSSC